MKKTDIAAFFDNCAPWWDSDLIRKEDIIEKILNNGGIQEGLDILDVACGTGVLFPDYLKRNVKSVTAIDISPEMVKIAAAKYPEIKVICGDVEETKFDKQFDAIMVYNAFPHFPNPGKLIEVLAGLVKVGGRLSVAHGMSRAALCDHHAGRAANVSIDLLHEEDLKALFEPYFEVDVVISDDNMYQVSGVRREGVIHTHDGHSHAHSHGHHHHDHSHHGGDIAPMDEMLALMKYMVSHNDAHAQEMANLADQLKDMGKTRAYEKIMDAVSDFDMLNAKFDAILKELATEEY